MKRLLTFVIAIMVAGILNAQVLTSVNTSTTETATKQKVINPKEQVSINTYYKGDPKLILDYQFSYSSGTFTSIASTGTAITPSSWDDGSYDLDLSAQGFSFPYNGQNYSVFGINTNGTIKFGGGYVSYSNDLSSTSYPPVVAPLWDDLKFYNSGSGDGLFYTLEDLPGVGQVLTVEWYNVARYNSQDNTVSFQVKLYAATGDIEVIYGDMSLAANWSASVSIGINDNEGANTASFLSITPGDPPTASYTTANNSISGADIAAIAEGTTYTFAMPQPLDNDMQMFFGSPTAAVIGDINFEAIVRNNGVNDQTDIPVSIVVNDGTNDVYTNTITIDALSAGEFDTVSLGTWNATNTGNYTVTMYTDLSSDEDHSNDTIRYNLTIVEQIITMQDGSASVCNALFYDSGGDISEYQNNEDYTYTFTASDPSKWIQVYFNYYNIENDYDKLYVYQGDEVNDSNLVQILTSTGNNLLIRIRDASVTFRFTSDGSVTRDGWEAVVSCYDPPQHEMGIVSVTPYAYVADKPFNPKVTLINNAINDESSYSLEYTNVDGSYAGNQSYTTTIAAGQSATVQLPTWTHSVGNDTLTVILHLASDEDASNDTIRVYMAFVKADAFAGNTGDGIYEFLNTANGNSYAFATIYSTPFPMAEDFDGTYIYRINYDWSFGKVDPNSGAYTQLGTISGSDGIPVGLAWDWDNNVFYIMALEGSNTDQAHLYTLDMTNLTLNSVGVGSTNTMIIGMDFANDGFLYGPSISDENLYKIDPATGELTNIGSTTLDLDYGQDVSYSYDKDSLYTVAGDMSSGSYVAKFGAYDLTSGAFTMIQQKAAQYATIVTASTPYDLYTVTFEVTDGSNPLPDAVINVAGRVLVTDDNGVATLNLGNGSYTANTSLSGYFDNSTDFTVSDADLTVNITLAQRPQYSITFNVANVLSTPLENTQITVIYQDNVFDTGNTDATGVYTTIPLYQGYSYIYSFVKEGYNTLVDTFAIYSDTTVDIVLIETMITPYALSATQQNFDADVLFEWNGFSPITEDFEAGALSDGWSVEQTCTDESGPIPGYWTVNDYSENNVQPYGTYSAGLWWSYYHQDERLITPSFNCVDNTFLTFYSYVYQGSTHGDHYYVEVSTDGGNTWTPVWDASALPSTGSFHTFQDDPYQIDLSAYAGQNIKLAFHAIDGDGQGLWYIWFVDNIAIDINGKVLKFRGGDLIASTSYNSNKNAENTAISKDGLVSPSESATPKVLQSYKVFLNYTLVATGITDSSYLFEDLAPGLYRFGVLGVYETGESDTAFIEYLVRGERTITVNVTNAIDNSPIEGANVTMVCDCDSSYTVATGADGSATIVVVDGNYTIDVSATGYTSYEDTAVINSDRTFNIQLQPLYTVNITVLNSETNQPVAGANITLTDGTNTYNLTTGSNGVATSNEVLYGDYEVSISKPGYYSLDTNLTVNDNVDVTYYLEQIPTDVVSDNYRIYPNPTDGIMTIEAKDNYTLELINVNGEVVYTTNINIGKNSIDIKNLPSGMYLMRLTSATEQVNVKILKN